MNMLQPPADFWEWIAAHAAGDPLRLRLKYGRSRALEILQIESRRKYNAKFGQIFSILPEFVIPNSLSPEQSTSWVLARFHASLVNEGSVVADLTAGMGIDVLAISERAAAVTAIERDDAIASVLAFNFRNLDKVTVLHDDCRAFITRSLAGGKHFGHIFIDPSRRADNGSRLYALSQCSPDVIALLPQLLRLADTVIVKASPMLDITHTLAALPATDHIYTVGTTTECKELVCVCSGTHAGTPVLSAVTTAGDRIIRFSFTRAEETAAKARFAAPQTGWYVYDPYPAVMKAAPYSLLGERYGLARLNPNTQLWTSPQLRTDFPGHIFKVEESLPYASRHIKRYAAAHPRISVTARNFDIDAATLRKKLGVSDGPGLRLFAVKGPSSEKLLITTTQVPPNL